MERNYRGKKIGKSKKGKRRVRKKEERSREIIREKAQRQEKGEIGHGIEEEEKDQGT
jgi:hypothetical protein